MNKNSIVVCVGLAVVLAGASAFAITPEQVGELKSALTSVSVPEMPAKTADLIANAKATDRSDVAKAAVRLAVERRPTMAATLVAEVSKSSPDLSAVSAVAASLQQPKQIAIITKAAVSAAPAQAAEIVAAMCKQFPSKYNLIAVAAFEAAPQAGKQILAAVAANVAFIKPMIEKALNSSEVDFGGVISNTEKLVVTAAADMKTSADSLLASSESAPNVATLALAPPTVGGPFQPVSPGSTTINRSNTSLINPGGSRNYSGP